MAPLKNKLILGLLFLWAVFPNVAFGSGDVVVVLSSNLKPYEAALAGFRHAYGKDVPVLLLTDGPPTLPTGARIVVAVGGKAAVYSYPPDTRLVYCLTPGVLIESGRYKNKPINIHISPSLHSIVSKLKAMQLPLKRLGVPWISDSSRDYLEGSEKIADELGVEIVATQLRDVDQLPDYLRASKGNIDALWLPPDPPLITSSNLSTIKEFSWGNDIPEIVSMDGLLDQGAAVSVSSSFAEIGETAAGVVAGIEEKTHVPNEIYPAKMEIGLNTTAAKKTNMTISPAATQIAARVLP